MRRKAMLAVRFEPRSTSTVKQCSWPKATKNDLTDLAIQAQLKVNPIIFSLDMLVISKSSNFVDASFKNIVSGYV